METRRLRVDGVSYDIRFQGFHQPLGVSLSGGEELVLRPWSCHEHLQALGRHLSPGETGVVLDVSAFCAEVLAHSGLSGERASELGPLALWWASGGDSAEVLPGADGLLELGAFRFRVRPWTQGERMKALANSLSMRPEGGPQFDAGAYLEAMLRASVQSLSPAGQQLEHLDAATTAGLLGAVVALNVLEEEPEQLLQEPLQLGAKQMAAETLRLCRALGWTPSRVWTTPAAEVDRLLRLLELVEGTQPAPSPVRTPPMRPSRPRLADHPDAIVIQIEDDAR